jgi:hypothetical protein
VTGGSATGGSATAGSVTGGSVTATGGSASAGTITSGTATSGTVSPGTATITVAGRQITGSAPGSVSIRSENSKAFLQLDNHQLTVESERLLLDGKERGRIPASAKKVEVKVTGGQLQVTADGEPVLKAGLAK